MRNRIRVGDTVNVYFEHVDAEHNVIVLYLPQATGDSWQVERTDGTIVAINSFAKMEQVKNED